MYYDPDRKGYNIGTCKKLKGSVYALVIYLDDDVSNWSHTEITYGAAPEIRTGLEYLETKAREWNAALRFRTGNYYTNYDEDTVIRYSGCVEPDVVARAHSADILSQAAASVGFSSIEEFHKFIKKFADIDQIMYFLVLNKKGRSYAMSDKINDGKDYIEYCVIYAKGFDGNYKGISSCVAHESLHLFGAEDYYDPYNRYPRRKLLAEKIYPNDIMMQTEYDVYRCKIGGFTAYCVGWTDKLPQECDCEDWWK